jgi:hypothetical protein
MADLAIRDSDTSSNVASTLYHFVCMLISKILEENELNMMYCTLLLHIAFNYHSATATIGEKRRFLVGCTAVQ